MRQINTYQIYELAKALQPLRTLPKDPASFGRDQFFPLFNAQWWLDNFLKEEKIPLDLSVNAAQRLSGYVEFIMNKVLTAANAEPNADNANALTQYEVNQIVANLDQFETVLNAELQKHLTYLVSQIGGYSMPLLTTKAEVNILEDALVVIGDQAKKDFREAGRCLAFEIPTAAGFHAMRATENVLRQYYSLLIKKPTDKIDWGTCLAELKKAAKANAKVIQVLDQIRDLHRNPLMHPQDFLTMNEAISLFDIAKSAIGSLAEEIAKLKAADAAAEEAAKKAKVLPASNVMSLPVATAIPKTSAS